MYIKEMIIRFISFRILILDKSNSLSFKDINVNSLSNKNASYLYRKYKQNCLKIEQTPKGKLLVTFHHDTILEFQNNGKKGKLVLQFFI